MLKILDGILSNSFKSNFSPPFEVVPRGHCTKSNMRKPFFRLRKYPDITKNHGSEALRVMGLNIGSVNMSDIGLIMCSIMVLVTSITLI